MKLPISFEEVSYFNNEYRGDLIVTKGVLYYFPHTRVKYARYDDELGGKEGMVVFDLLGNIAPFFAAVPWIRTAAENSMKAGKFLKRSLRPSMNTPRIREKDLWSGSNGNEDLQSLLVKYIDERRSDGIKFDDDSVPNPMRFAVAEVENLRFGLKLKFDAKYDDHDFRVNLMHRGILRKALVEAGFIK